MKEINYNPYQPTQNLVGRLYWVEHCYRDDWGVYYCDDGKLIKTAYHGTEKECRDWIKDNTI